MSMSQKVSEELLPRLLADKGRRGELEGVKLRRTLLFEMAITERCKWRE
jgi:hypothetical protein